MTPLLPFPAASAGLLATWLLLNQSLSPGISFWRRSFRCWWLGIDGAEAAESPGSAAGAILVCLSLVLADIVRSNLAVAGSSSALAGGSGNPASSKSLLTCEIPMGWRRWPASSPPRPVPCG